MRWRLLFIVYACGLVTACSAPAPDRVARPNTPPYLERGRSLVRGLAACGFCHGEEPRPEAVLSGGQEQYDRYGAVPAANITPARAGIGGWSTNEVLRALRSAVAPGGELLSQEVHRGYEWLSDDDALSVAAYLWSLPPVEQEVERRHVTALERNTTGFFESAPEIRGLVPSISPRFQVAYGRYLVDQVARCGYCHTTPAGFVSSAQYLAGGKLVKTASGEKRAPGLTSSAVDGLGSWTEQDIVQFLASGTTPEGRTVDPASCPIAFYRNASPEDAVALAKYLKTVPAAD